jgi:hypothetical protein
MRCEPANTIIQKFGGLSALAEVAGVSAHSVMRWRTPRERGGTGGVIPHWHVPKLLAEAEKRKIKVRAADFVHVKDAA